MRVGFNADNPESFLQVVGGVVAVKHSDVVHETHRRDLRLNVRGFAAMGCRIHEVMVNSRLREQINRNERKQKIRNKHRSSSVILGHSLAQE